MINPSAHFASAIQTTCNGPWLIVQFPEPQICLSWAIVGGGRTMTDTIAWYYLRHEEEPELHDPVAFFHAKLSAAAMPHAVGLLTARKRYGQVVREYSYAGINGFCIATIGLKNALRIGDPPSCAPTAGTINIVCWVSAPLSEHAELEALALISEARTAAMLAHPKQSTASQAFATGTGTDYFVLAHPHSADVVPYAGKHTAVGHVIGKLVYDVLHQAIGNWHHEFSNPQAHP